MSNLTKNVSPEDKKMLNSIFLRSFSVFASCAGGSVKAGADGWLYSVQPALNRYYADDPEARAEAMKRHTTWYNITQNVGTFAMGLVASMERENSQHEDFDTESIDGIKVSLMGPMSGIGDAIFWGVLRVIAAGIGINLAMSGSPLGAIMFLLIYNIPSILCRYFMTYLGFSMGTNFISEMYEGGLMKLITKATSTVGLVMIGAMTAANVQFNTILSIPVQDSDPVMIQTYLDSIFKGIVPLGLTLVVLWLLRKKNVNVNIILVGIMVLALVLGLVGIVQGGFRIIRSLFKAIPGGTRSRTFDACRPIRRREYALHAPQELRCRRLPARCGHLGDRRRLLW